MRLFRVGTAVLFGALLTAEASSKNDLTPEEALVQWIRQQGGFVNPKQEIRGSQHSTDPRGVYATEDLSAGELLVTLPSKLLMGDQQSHTDMCDSAIFMDQERRLGSASFFAPYLSLLNHSHVSLPDTYSEAGKHLLKVVVGDNLPPQDIGRHLAWYEHCAEHCAAREDRIPERVQETLGRVENEYDQDTLRTYLSSLQSEIAELRGRNKKNNEEPLDRGIALSMLTRALGVNNAEGKYVNVIPPFYDMYNHDHVTEENCARYFSQEKGFQAVLIKNVQKGQQITHQYGWELTLPEIFRDYGFVPLARRQEWTLSIPPNEYPPNCRRPPEIMQSPHLIHFNLKKGDDPKDDEVTWLSSYPPSEEGVEFLKRELERLARVKEEAQQVDVENMPAHEAENIWRYHKALTEAIAAAFVSAQKAQESSSEASQEL